MLVFKSKFLLIAFLLFTSCVQNNINSRFKEMGINIELEKSFEIVSVFEEPIVFNLKKNKNLLKILIIKSKSRDEALEKARVQNGLKLLAFDRSVTPYPGQMTTAANCDEKLRPKKIESKNLSYFNYFANERMAMVSCQNENIKYQVATSYYISGSSLVIVDYYTENKISNVELTNFLINNFKKLELVYL